MSQTHADPRPPQVLDAHTHAFPDPVAARAIPKLEAECVWEPCHAYADGTIAGLLASMERAGIDRAVVASVATRPEQVPKITDWSASIASDRIVPLASIHPDFDEVEAEVERIRAAGLAGLKFHPQYMGCALDDPRAIRIARAAEAAGLAILFHTGYDLAYEADELAGPAQVRRLHEAAPSLRMIAAHMGGWRRWDEALAEVAGLPVYLETSYTIGWCPPEKLARLFEKHPPEYILFGTDSPWTDQAEQLARFLALDSLPDETKRMALWENGLRFLGI